MNNIFIFDDFYSDPLKVREFALNCQYTLNAPKHWKNKNEDVLWPGKVTESTYKEKDVDIKFSKLIGTVIRSSSQSGFFRLSPELETTEYVVHVDGFNNKTNREFTGVVYLNTPDQCQNKIGTVFYKHKKTGKIKIDNPQDFMLSLHDWKVDDAWEVYKVIDLKFNRLVVLETNLFHSVGDCFGSMNEDSRLAQIFALNEIK